MPSRAMSRDVLDGPGTAALRDTVLEADQPHVVPSNNTSNLVAIKSTTRQSRPGSSHHLGPRKDLSVDLPPLREGWVLQTSQRTPLGLLDEGETNENSAILIPASPPEKRGFKGRLKKCCTPPRCLQRCCSWIYRKCGAVAAYGFFFLLIYALLWVFTGDMAVTPKCFAYVAVNSTQKAAVCYGGTTLDIIIFYAISFTCGQLVELIRLPGLLGEPPRLLINHFRSTWSCVFS